MEVDIFLKKSLFIEDFQTVNVMSDGERNMRKRTKKEGTIHKKRQKGKRTKEKRTTRETKKERKMGVTQVDISENT